jgi:hypothetical protein
MPEITNPSRKERAYTIVQAEPHSPIVRMHCHYCKITRHYLTRDFITLLGAVPVYSLADHFFCDNCKKKDYLSAKCISLNGDQIGRTKVLRLTGIKIIRRPVWENGVM